MRKVLSTVVLFAIAAGVLLWDRGGDSDKVRKQVYPFIQAMPEYKAEAAFLDPCFDRAHSHAFGEAYTMRGRRRAAKMDFELYLNELFKKMADECRSVQKMALADSLFKLKSELQVVKKEQS